MNTSNLNILRLTLSSEISHYQNEIDLITTKVMDKLTFKQFRRFQSFHTKFECLSIDQVNRITKSKSIRELWFKASVMHDRIIELDTKCDEVLSQLESISA